MQFFPALNLAQPPRAALASSRSKAAMALTVVTGLITGGCSSLAEFAVVNAGLPTLPDIEQPDLLPEFTVPADGALTILINDRPLLARAGPGLTSRAQISTEDAAALFGPGAEDFDRRGTWPGALRSATRIGPVVVRSHRALAQISLTEPALPLPYPANIEWSAGGGSVRAAQLGPFAIPAMRVRFTLREPLPGEQDFTLPLDPENNGWGIASTTLMAGQQRMRFSFAPHFPRSVASAVAGGALARSQGGRFTGMPEPITISHGVARPARPVQLDRSFAIGPLRLRDILVRTLDYGTAAGIADQVEEADNPADILVTGRTDRQAPNYIVYLGADVLAGCSSITFDKAAMTITLRCVTQA
jgi:hypothetical protein